MIRTVVISSIALGLVAGSGMAATEVNKQTVKAEDTHKTEQAEQKPDPARMAELLKIMPDDYVMGDRNAKVTIFEYASLSCPHCAEFKEKTLPRIYDTYIKSGKVNLVFRDFPLNEPAFRASLLARCAARQNKEKGDDVYYRYLKVLFSSQKSWALDKEPTAMLQKIAALGGMGKETFEKCMEDKELEKQLLESRKNAADVLKVRSTPSFYVGGKELTGTRVFEEFAGVIEAALKEK